MEGSLGQASYTPEGHIHYIKGAEQTLVNATERIREIDEEISRFQKERQDQEKAIWQAKEELATKLDAADAAVVANQPKDSMIFSPRVRTENLPPAPDNGE